MELSIDPLVIKSRTFGVQRFSESGSSSRCVCQCRLFASMRQKISGRSFLEVNSEVQEELLRFSWTKRLKVDITVTSLKTFSGYDQAEEENVTILQSDI